MNSKLSSQDLNYLYKGILSLNDVDECAVFFDDLCTAAELKALSQRFHVAKLLQEGWVYNDIAEQTGASTATISRVNRAMQYGSDGYKIVLERVK